MHTKKEAEEIIRIESLTQEPSYDKTQMGYKVIPIFDSEQSFASFDIVPNDLEEKPKQLTKQKLKKH